MVGWQVVGQMPWLDEVLEKNPLIPQFMRGTSYIIKIGSAHIEKRLKDIRSKIPTPKNDFLAKFIAGEDKVQNTDQKPMCVHTAPSSEHPREGGQDGIIQLLMDCSV